MAAIVYNNFDYRALEYARAAGVYMEVLVDDKLDLPEKLPANPKSEGIMRKRSTRK